VSATQSVDSKSGGEIKYSDILIRIFSIKEVISKLRTLLNSVGIKHLYVFVDDFSELPEEAIGVVVDSILAPLNNWSDELIKFKVAAYPGRRYYGAIDKSKIDEQNLDVYSLYGTTDVSDMEEKCIDFTNRLVQSRLDHYCSCGMDIFASSDEPDFWKTLFYATSGNPRNLGYLLYYLYESHLTLRDDPKGISSAQVKPSFPTRRVASPASPGLRELNQEYSRRTEDALQQAV